MRQLALLASLMISCGGKPAPKPAQVPLKTATPEIKCPSLIGMGVKTVRSFCDVPAGRDPALGIVVTLPPHTGTGTLSFELHARHVYSEDAADRDWAVHTWHSLRHTS